MKYIIFILCLFGAQLHAAEIGKLLSNLNSSDYGAQTQARDSLLVAFAEASAPGADGAQLAAMLGELYPQLNDSTPLPSRLYLIHLIELFGAVETTQAIYPLLGDPEPAVRDSARRALAAHSDEQSNVFLMNGLKRAPLEQRASFIQALVYSQYKPAAAEMLQYLKSDNTELQAITAWGLGMLGVVETRSDLFAARSTVAPENVELVEAALLQLGVNAAAAELLVQSGRRASIRVGAFQQLIALDPAMAEGILKTALADTDFPARAGLISVSMRSAAENLRMLLIDTFGKLSVADQMLIVAAISDRRLSQYEPMLIDLLASEDFDLKMAAVDALGWVGGDASFKGMYALVLENPEDDLIVDALSRLNAPVADESLLAAAKNLGDRSAALAALQIVALRNSPGGTDLINLIARDAKDAALAQAAFKAMERIGDLGSVKVLVDIIMREDNLKSAAQRSLKRLSLSFGVPDLQWETVYEPALAQASSASQKEGLILILDAIPCAPSLAYLYEAVYDPELRPSVLRTLQRWSRYEVALLWVKFAMEDGAPAKDVATAVKALERLFSSESMAGSFEDKIDSAAAAVSLASGAELKMAILSGFQKNVAPWHRGRLIKAFKPLGDDPDVGDVIRDLMKKNQS
jgi:hypothetical protein